ncbi:MAG: TM0106 family RecB-like putative nuclease [Acidimicrobiia bacterium]
MQLIDGRLVLSPGDLTGHLDCEHLSALDLSAARGERERPGTGDATLDVLRRRGDEHERRYLELLRGQGLDVVEVDRGSSTLLALAAAEAATVEAMASGADAVHGGTFFDGRWRAHPDVLLRVDRPSARWRWSYEVAGANLSRRVGAGAILGACACSEQVERVQGSAPELVHVVGGDLQVRSHPLGDFAAYHRRVKAGFEAALASSATVADSCPDRVPHCSSCGWAATCDERRRSADHLSLVAGMRRTQARRLAASGIRTVEGLASTPGGVPGTKLSAPTLARLRHQARLQVAQRRSGLPGWELLPPEPGQGLSLLPAPTAGDLFFDMEGDPFAGEGGLEYLFGVAEWDVHSLAHRSFWAHTPAEEKAAFEAFVDFVTARLDANPALHVFHYAPYEATALKRLMGVHATRDEAVDRILRAGVLVDLYQVVRQGLRISTESYSLKALEPLYMDKRAGAITDAGSSVVAYEEWLATGEQRILDEIGEYNRVDCESTWRLRDWLERRRAELDVSTGETLARPEPRSGDASEAQRSAEAETRALVERLATAVPADGEGPSPREAATWLLAHLLDWHRREARPEWWAHFSRLAASEEELLDDADAIAGLVYEGAVEEVARSVVHRYRFPAQEHKLRPGDTPHDPRSGRAAGTVQAVDPVAGTLDLRRGKASSVVHPAAVVAAPPIGTTVLRQALGGVGEWVAEHGIDAPGPYRAVRDLLLGAAPRLASRSDAAGSLTRPGETPLAAARRLGLALDHGCLPVQGPPGTGKTYTGARMIVDLVAAGRRVGVTATSHRAITNLLDEVCRAAAAAGVDLSAVQRADSAEACSAAAVTRLDSSDGVAARLAAGDVGVVAGTPWLFARRDMAGAVDVLVVDEAGQMSLANVVAMGAATDNLVLLGDPRQLAQPSKGVHPPGADRSALEHLLGDDLTVAPDRGLLLDVTYRLHPDICAFVSEVFYEGRLHADGGCGRQRIGEGPWAAGSGVRFVAVDHTGNRVSSPEEADEVAARVGALLGRHWTDRHGRRRRLGVDDILVVAPYNAQVARLQAVLPGGVRVGTVDRFQGQEAAVVIFSLTTSCADDLPRGAEFLLSPNRFNVAVSRARALALVVGSPGLLTMRCDRPEQIRLVNTLCRLAEFPTADTAPHAAA